MTTRRKPNRGRKRRAHIVDKKSHYSFLGQHLRAIRKREGIPVAALCNNNHYTKVETGVSYPGLSKLREWLKFLGATPDECRIAEKLLLIAKDKYIFDMSRLSIDDRIRWLVIANVCMDQIPQVFRDIVDSMVESMEMALVNDSYLIPKAQGGGRTGFRFNPDTKEIEQIPSSQEIDNG